MYTHTHTHTHMHTHLDPNARRAEPLCKLMHDDSFFISASLINVIIISYDNIVILYIIYDKHADILYRSTESVDGARAAGVSTDRKNPSSLFFFL